MLAKKWPAVYNTEKTKAQEKAQKLHTKHQYETLLLAGVSQHTTVVRPTESTVSLHLQLIDDESINKPRLIDQIFLVN